MEKKIFKVLTTLALSSFMALGVFMPDMIKEKSANVTTVYAGYYVYEGVCGEKLTWAIDNYGTLGIYGEGDMYDYTEDKPAPWAEYSDDINSISIRKSEITHIGAYAFAGLDNVTGVFFDENGYGLESIGENAFYGCVNITGVLFSSNTFGSDINKWMQTDFANQYAQPFVSSEKECGFYSDKKLVQELTLGYVTYGQKISNYAFTDNKLLTKVDIGYGITSIGEYAFCGCLDLKEVDYYYSLITIGKYAFANCTSLDTFRYSTPTADPSLQSLKRIEDGAFLNCESMKFFAIPDSVEYVGMGVFSLDSKLETITVGKNVKYFGKDEEGNEGTIFDSCNSLIEITFNGPCPEKMSETAFKDVTAVAYYNLPGWTSDQLIDYSGNITWECRFVIGWLTKDGNVYYYDDNACLVYGWQKIDDEWYFFDEEGIMQTGWKKLNNKWYYFAENGKMVKGWQKINNKWYYFEASGVMVTNWKKIGDKWYYFGTSGVMATGWQKINDKWYYFGASGVMQTGWKKISNKWYYFGTSGAMATGWQKINNKWYYFDKSGVMQTSKWVGNYYLKADGSMAISEYVADGDCYVDENGKRIA